MRKDLESMQEGEFILIQKYQRGYPVIGEYKGEGQMQRKTKRGGLLGGRERSGPEKSLIFVNGALKLAPPSEFGNGIFPVAIPISPESGNRYPNIFLSQIRRIRRGKEDIIEGLREEGEEYEAYVPIVEKVFSD